MKSNAESDDNGAEPGVDTNVPPSSPTGHGGTFGAIEPSLIAVPSDFTLPSADYKWNQIIELSLPDGRKVGNSMFY